MFTYLLLLLLLLLLSSPFFVFVFVVVVFCLIRTAVSARVIVRFRRSLQITINTAV